MALIAPTVETIGDEALTNSIIDRSITELQDNLVAEIGPAVLMGSRSLTKVVLGSASTIGEKSFGSCNALTTADIHSVVTIESGAFMSCSTLSAFILRGETVSTLSNANAFSSSGIQYGTGYIYVPAALVDSYKTATNWSTYANQIRAIEDYPEICDPYSWETVAKTIENGTYKDVYKIGDTVPVDLGSEGIINMQIAAFDADTLADGSGTAAISWVGKELLKTGSKFNPSLVTNDDGTYQEGTGAIGGWEKCEMRRYIQNTVEPLIPVDVASMIRPVSKTQPAVDTTGSSFNQTTTDDLWIPAESEIERSTSVYGGLFPDNASRIKYVGTTKRMWAVRDSIGTKNCKGVSTSGGIGSNMTTSTHYIALGFCTGRTP